MRALIAAFAASVLLAIPMAPAQIQIAQIQIKEGAPAAAPTKTPQPETSGGDKRNPEPHIYKLGEHLSEAYGSYEIVDNWQREKLMAPPGRAPLGSLRRELHARHRHRRLDQAHRARVLKNKSAVRNRTALFEARCSSDQRTRSVLPTVR